MFIYNYRGLFIYIGKPQYVYTTTVQLLPSEGCLYKQWYIHSGYVHNSGHFQILILGTDIFISDGNLL